SADQEALDARSSKRRIPACLLAIFPLNPIASSAINTGARRFCRRARLRAGQARCQVEGTAEEVPAGQKPPPVGPRWYERARLPRREGGEDRGQLTQPRSPKGGIISFLVAPAGQ